MNGRKNGGKWHDHEVVEYFDTHLNVTIRELSRMSGWNERETKRILEEYPFH